MSYKICLAVIRWNTNGVLILILLIVKNSRETRRWKDGRVERYKTKSLSPASLEIWLANGWQYLHIERIRDTTEGIFKPKRKEKGKEERNREEKEGKKISLCLLK